MIQDVVVIDYTKQIAICAHRSPGDKENDCRRRTIPYRCKLSLGRHCVCCRDSHQRQGIGSELLSYMTYLAKRQGLLGFTAAVLMENEPMLNTFAKGGFDITGKLKAGFYDLKLAFRK